MARINKAQLTKTEILQVASRLFLEKGYSNTSVRAISDELEMSTGNVTFYYPTKEHMLAELVKLLSEFQWKQMEREAQDGNSKVVAVCLELVTMAYACQEDEVARDIFISSYQSPLCLEVIRQNDARRAQLVFAEYRPDWTSEQYDEAEILVSGVEYATLTSLDSAVPFETRLSGALHNILGIYNLPPALREQKIKRVFELDYQGVGKRTLENFRNYVEQANEQAFMDLLKCR